MLELNIIGFTVPGGCDFEVDFCNWTNEASRDDFDWLQHSGRTPSTKTGPSSDRTEEGIKSVAF